MEHFIELNTCPLCGNAEKSLALKVKDFTVSKLEFNIQSCTSCGFQFTSPRPSSDVIGAYYKSDDYISHTDSNKSLFDRVYQLVKKYALVKKLQVVMQHSGIKKGRLLDFGCGTGAFVEFSNSNGWDAHGFEPDDTARELALKKSPNKITGSLEDIQVGFDAISLWHVLEHVEDVHQTIGYLLSKLNPQGVLIIAVPNRSSYDAEYYKEFWAAYDVPRHLYHFVPADMNLIAEKHGLRLITTLPMIFDSFYVSLLSERYRGGNPIRAFFIGLLSNIKANRTGKTFSSQIYVFKRK